MTDTANAPERIWAFHAGPMVGLFIGKKEVGTNVSEYILATHCDELVAAARAEGAREAEARWARANARCAVANAKIARLTEALKDAVEIVHKSYVLATMEAVNAGPASPTAASHDAWRAKCVRVEECARAAIQDNADE